MTQRRLHVTRHKLCRHAEYLCSWDVSIIVLTERRRSTSRIRCRSSNNRKQQQQPKLGRLRQLYCNNDNNILATSVIVVGMRSVVLWLQTVFFSKITFMVTVRNSSRHVSQFSTCLTNKYSTVYFTNNSIFQTVFYSFACISALSNYCFNS